MSEQKDPPKRQPSSFEALPEELKQAMAGKHVLIVCAAPFDAEKKCAAFFNEHCRDWSGPFATRRHSISHISGGLIEWGWVNSSSGRRADDFHHQTFDTRGL